MRKLVVTTFLALDGVMQAPGAPEEDRAGGFSHGGWLVPYADEDMGHDLIDELRLIIFPVVLSEGKQLFAGGTVPAAMKLASSSATSTGALIATYERAGAVTTGSFALDQA